MTTFLAKLIAGISKQMLIDLLGAILKEIFLNEKQTDLVKNVAYLKAVINEIDTAEGMTDHEKNAKLIDAGRNVIDGLRKR